MERVIFIIIFMVFFAACQQESLSEKTNNNETQLNSINTTKWDSASRQIIEKMIGTPFEEFSYIEKKHLSEILITHKNYSIATSVLNNLNYKKSQYLTFLMATAQYEQGYLQTAVMTLDEHSDADIDVSLLHLKYKILLELGQADTVILSADTQPNNFTSILSKYYLAMAYLQNNHCHKAISLFAEVLNAQPDANSLYAPLSKAYQQCKQTEQAKITRAKLGNNALSDISDFPNRLLKNGNPVQYFRQILSQALIDNNSARIIETSEILINLNAANPKLLTNLAITLFQAKQLKKANNALYTALKIDKNDIKTHQLLYEFNKISNFEVAEKALNQLQKIDPHNTKYQQAKILLYSTHKRQLKQ